MVWPLAVASIASSVLGAGSSIMGNNKAREAAEKQADMTYMQRMEEIRRTKEDQAHQLGYNIAAVGASNIQMSGSAERSINDMRATFARDIGFREQSARMEKRAIEAGAPGSSADFGALAQAGTSIASTIMTARG